MRQQDLLVKHAIDQSGRLARARGCVQRPYHHAIEMDAEAPAQLRNHPGFVRRSAATFYPGGLVRKYH
jgi:hypothetical protein